MFDFNTDSGQIRMYGDVGQMYPDGISDVAFLEALDAMDGRDVELIIQSHGGSVFEGISIFNQLREYPGNVSVRIDALAASIASVIMLGGSTVTANQSSVVMVHDPWAGAVGNATLLREAADMLELLGRQTADIYASRSAWSRDQWLEIMQKDTYLSAAEAQEIGLVNELVDFGDGEAAAKMDMTPVATGPAVVAKGPKYDTALIAARMRAARMRKKS